MESDGVKILLCMCGSVATIKAAEIVMHLKSQMPGAKVYLVPTEKAVHFLPQHVEADKTYYDKDEWEMWQKRGDPVLHIDLRKWADVLLIAPMDANTLAKVSQGLADNLLTCICRAWDFKKPCFFAPAMNTFMWEHPVTAQQVSKLKDWGYIEIPCIEKVLMCKDKGLGAMAEPQTIASTVSNMLQ